MKAMDHWCKFSTIHTANGKVGYEIAAGINSYGDGPERTIGTVFGISDKDFLLLISAPEMLNTLRKVEYWLDLPEEDFEAMPELDAISHRMQLANIRAVIAKVIGAPTTEILTAN